jgi:phage tail protein X
MRLGKKGKRIMQFITTKIQTTLMTLTHEVFDIHGAKSAAAKLAQAVLREANPHLADLTKIPAGTLVIVPDAPGTKPAVGQSLTGVSPAVVAQLKQALTDAGKVVKESVASETEEAQTSLTLVKDLKRFDIRELRNRQAQIAEQANLQLEQIKAAGAKQLRGLAQLQKDLGSLNQ